MVFIKLVNCKVKRTIVKNERGYGAFCVTMCGDTLPGCAFSLANGAFSITNCSFCVTKVAFSLTNF